MSIFTKPQICPKRPKESDMAKPWRVRFRFFHAGTWHQISRKYEINHIKRFTERLLEAKAIQKVLAFKLAQGWNPVTNTYPHKTAQEMELEQLQSMTFAQALDWAYNVKKKDWKPKSQSDYRSKIKYLKLAAPDKPVKDFRKFDFKLTLQTVEHDRKLSPAGYNIYRDYLSTLIGVLAEWDIVESNPIQYISLKDVPKNKAHRPPTQEERNAIVAKSKEINPAYYRFLAVVYGCAIRPVEITRLRISHFRKAEGVFRMTADISKNKMEEDVAIPDWLMDVLAELRPDKYPPHYFLFGGKPNSFGPGPKQMAANSSRYWWNKIVREELKLKTSQYAMKKMAADDLVKLQHQEGANGLLSLAKTHLRHQSEGQTAVYTGMDKEIMKEIIQRHMPVL